MFIYVYLLCFGEYLAIIRLMAKIKLEIRCSQLHGKFETLSNLCSNTPRQFRAMKCILVSRKTTKAAADIKRSHVEGLPKLFS
jgi:hypothetical protein